MYFILTLVGFITVILFTARINYKHGFAAGEKKGKQDMKDEMLKEMMSAKASAKEECGPRREDC